MKIGLKDILVVLVLFVGSGFYFFLKSVTNTRGLIINHLFTLNVTQANAFYFVMGCLCIFILAPSGIAVYIQNRKS